MKYTAIEWLVEQLEGDDAMIARVIGLKKYNEIYKKAKEMEKEQIKDAYGDGLNAHRTDFCNREEYYQQKYKNK
jgi:GTP-dependent phosphoenolpyruvate carboxykinase